MEIPPQVKEVIGNRTVEECAIEVVYTNYRSETSVRKIIPLRIFIGSTEYHSASQYLLEVWDIEKNAPRTYALADIKEWKNFPDKL